ncbi:hypothetical protein O5D80_001904 [Batrachochytrium dendrobatidis]|nr:hypothetical protein O5D80_000059 [Batrachochytrium dendrobatidis]KAJ8329973.1 hypothetical protein O5D80_001904 [Batrachochytrium dendrobatidis]
MKLVQWSIVLGFSSMALAAVPSDSPEDNPNLQRRALELELPEQDVHMFARSPMPQVLDSDSMPGGSGQSDSLSQRRLIRQQNLEKIERMTVERDKLQKSLDAKRAKLRSGLSPSDPDWMSPGLKKSLGMVQKAKEKQEQKAARKLRKQSENQNQGRKKGLMSRIRGAFKGKPKGTPSATKAQKKAARAARHERIDKKYDPRMQRLKEKQAARAQVIAQKRAQFSSSFGKMMGKQ